MWITIELLDRTRMNPTIEVKKPDLDSASAL